mmetsp:Transcript_43553/g.130613  ORF Transcript_43553/g.130613 Transcript_43553/m.130613 type:complete len:229 (-) Transcript_43553:57-743(-)
MPTSAALEALKASRAQRPSPPGAAPNSVAEQRAVTHVDATGASEAITGLSGAPNGDEIGMMSSNAAGASICQPLTTKVLGHAWICGECNNECVPIRSESRCMCGHRLKEHRKLKPGATEATCGVSKCQCSGFSFIMAEGAWILRCSCKHKHVEHDPKTHACNKAGCKCGKFNSPWVCNCDHPWAAHKQILREKEVLTLQGLMAGASLQEVGGGIATDVNRLDMIRRGL